MTKSFTHFVFILYFSMGTALAAPFDSCPSEAFLVQDDTARIYGVNLATGYYEELSNSMGTSGKINGIGFSFHDDYIYGWGYEAQTIVRIGSDFQAAPLNLSNNPGTNFYVGDVSVEENAYYFYKRGSSYGLYKASLDESSPDYLLVNQIISGGTLNLRIFDFAFHPTDNDLYSVDSSGNLHRINANTGQPEALGNVGESGTFGAVYFDSLGNFYISRNSDGYIFRIDLSSASPTAEFFAFGPSSSNNDGARCALADIITEASTVDFGDAPDSYGTSLESNGARHEISEDLYLGENTSGTDDGVNFVTGFETGYETLIQIIVTGEGVLNAWVDWDQNGTFDSNEQALVDQVVDGNEQRLLIDVPTDAPEGSTWARFRLSTQTGIGPTGGVQDGEVEDHPVIVSANALQIESYPSDGGFVTLAFEDNWPAKGDYDMNDVVIAYRTRRYIDEADLVHRFDIEGHLLGLGASYHNGFAVQLDDIPTQNVNANITRFEINGQQQNHHPIEDNPAQADAVVVITNDLWQSVNSTSGCAYYRTESGCEQTQDFRFKISVPLNPAISLASAPHSILNPFIFASPNTYHGEVFAEQPGRSLEIHLKNKRVTSRFNTSFWRLGDDASSPENNLRFLTENHMPWALEVPMLWSHPLERIDVINAYPQFLQFVESLGQENTTWYTKPNAQHHLIMDN